MSAAPDTARSAIRTAVAPVSAGPTPLAWALSLVPVALMFLAAVFQMRADWTYDETYHYGWAVPALTVYLVFSRWRDRPAAGPAAGIGLAGWAVAGAMLMATWIVREANADWRPIAIGLTASALASSWAWLGECGGRPWQRHFFGAVAFFAVGMPWPTMLEKAVTDGLMPANAVLAIEALHWLGVPALRNGNLIALADGTLGVEEACSGIRSLQATLMMAVFLGELFRLRGRHRIGLVVLGFVVALLTNALRTVILSAIAAKHSLAEAARWHDSLGLAVLVAHGAVLFAAALRLPPADRNPTVVDDDSPVAPPRRGPAILFLLIVATLPVTRAWYHRSEPDAPASAWKLLPPTGAEGFTPVPIPGKTRLTLRYDDGWSARWRSPQEHQFQAFYFEWRPGTVRIGNLASHRPENCLRNVGAVLESESADPIDVEVGDRRLPVKLFRFNDHGRPLYVAFFVEEISALAAMSNSFESTSVNRRRIEAVLKGCRNEGQRFLEVGVWGASSEVEARRILEGYLRDHLKAALPSAK